MMEAVGLYLVLRHEGSYLNAYATSNDELTDAVLLGGILAGAIIGNKLRQRAFASIMDSVINEFIAHQLAEMEPEGHG